MMTSVTRALLCAAAFLAAAVPAQAAPLQRYFDCDASTPVQNARSAAYSWSETAPATSSQQGGGCAYAEPGLLVGTNPGNPVADAVFGGSYAGEISQIDLTLYSETTGHPLNGTLINKTINVAVEVDGELVGDYQQLEASVQEGVTVGSKKYTWVLPDLAIPATAQDKQIVLTVQTYYSDDFTPWVFGASDFPAGVALYGTADLPL